VLPRGNYPATRHHGEEIVGVNDEEIIFCTDMVIAGAEFRARATRGGRHDPRSAPDPASREVTSRPAPQTATDVILSGAVVAGQDVIRTVLPGSRRAAASSCTAPTSVSGRRAAMCS